MLGVLPPVLARASGLLAQAEARSVDDACGSPDEAGFVCERIFDWTGSEVWAKTADFVVARPLKVVLILLVAWVVNRLVRRTIRKFVQRLSDDSVHQTFSNLRSRTPAALVSTGQLSPRVAARAETLGAVFRSLASGVIWTIALLMVLGQLGVNLGPLIAGAGIVGVALGFGSQALVRDFLSGIFMLIEDQLGVGDIVDVGDAIGRVEGVSLRTTRLRDLEGTVWYLPNGEIRRVGNMSQEWARALLDIEVAYGTDLERASVLIKEVADEFWRGSDDVLDEPEIWGVEALLESGIAIRLVVKTRPSRQWAVARGLRQQIKARFDEEGIEIPFPQRTVWVRQDDGAALAGTEPPPEAVEATEVAGDDAPAEADPGGGGRRRPPRRARR